MAGMAQGGRGRRILGIAIIVVPWLLRDQMAAWLDTTSTASQQIRVALDNEEARQIEERDQRATVKRVVLLEQKVAGKEEDADNDQTYRAEIDSAGEELKRSVTSFRERVSKSHLDHDETAKVDQAGNSAIEAADSLIAEFAKPATSDQQDKAVLAHFDSSASTFFNEIKALSKQATEDAEAYSTSATLSRFGAWIMTAIGAVMLGGWKALMRDVVEAEGTKADGET